MGTILKVSCNKCGYTKDLYYGCGISGCNINMIQNRFSDEIFSANLILAFPISAIIAF